MTTSTATRPVTFKSELLGTVTLSTYVDPHPDKVGTDSVFETCGRCGGRGRIDAFGHVYGGVCFECQGAGQVPVRVSTVRRWAKRDAFAAEYRAELQAHRAAQEAAAAAAMAEAEYAAAWDAAHAEDARRATLVQGFLGQVGEKVAVTGTVAVAKYIEGSWNRSSSIFLIVKADSGQVIKTFGSGASLFALDRGHRVELTGKVKGHETYQGQDQTVLSHVKATIVEEVDAG